MAGKSPKTTSSVQQLVNEYNNQAPYNAAKKKLTAEKKKYEKDVKKYMDANIPLLRNLQDPGGYNEEVLFYQKEAETYVVAHPKPRDAGETAALNAIVANLATAQKGQADTRAKIKANNLAGAVAEEKIRKIQADFNKKWTKDGKGKVVIDPKSDPTKPGKGGKGPWYYNVPLIKAAYFSPLLGINKNSDGWQFPTPPPSGMAATGDAINFWQTTTGNGVTPGKGTFQMDRVTNTVETLATIKKGSAKPEKVDGNFYGFQFMYNPTTVNMTWGAIMGANPVYEAMALDPAIPFTSNLMSSTISFDILLNRIEDINVLNADGKYKGNQNPYDWDVKEDELKKIYAKGTMYDLEYLFKTLHGYASYTNFASSLNSATQTYDHGWLPIRPVELHLGSQLRYRVRVVDLTVKHSIFDKRMVPLLSVVSFTCARYWDGTVATKGKK